MININQKLVTVFLSFIDFILIMDLDYFEGSIFKITDTEYIHKFNHLDNRIKIWSEERLIDENRVKTISDYYENNNKTLGVWIGCKYKNNQDIYLIDGQHRAKAFKNKKFNKPIVIHIYIVEKEEDILDLFIHINKSFPVSEIYFNISSKKELLNSIEEYKNLYIKKINKNMLPRVSLSL